MIKKFLYDLLLMVTMYLITIFIGEVMYRFRMKKVMRKIRRKRR